METKTILDQIDLGSYALPEFQRGYVWNGNQVKKLMNSLYRGYPIGGLLTWVTPTNANITRGKGHLQPGTVNLILDGQQRITSLYGIINGKPPQFFEGNAAAFTGLYFNLKDEVFEFYAPLKMKDDPNWISVTRLMQEGVGNYVQNSENKDYLIQNFDKLNKINNIKQTDLHIEQVAGEDKTIDVVVEIFNNVNSGGTKLSKGDLALAKICAQWPEARERMRKILGRLKAAGYDFEMDWLLRCVTVYLTNKAYFSELSTVSIESFKLCLKETERLIDTILNQIGSRLGLDHKRVLGSRYSIPLMISYIKKKGASKLTNAEWNKLLYWYVHTFLWGRYAGSTESVLAQDLNILDKGEDVDGLIRQLRTVRGDLTVSAIDFYGWSTGARFYPLLYMLTRASHARDWGSGIELSSALLGKHSSLQLHHIYPKNLLYKNGYTKSLVNALANYSFLTQETNGQISDRPPAEYVPEYMEKQPGAVESHWLPLDDMGILSTDRYEEFLEKRRELLAEQANKFLNALLDNSYSVIPDQIDYANRPNQVDSEESEEETLLSISIWMEENGLNTGEINYELTDEDGNIITIIDLAWPKGIQQGLTEPLALLLKETQETQSFVSSKGYKFYTDENLFINHIKETYLSE